MISIARFRLDPHQCQSETFGIPRLGVSRIMSETATMDPVPDGEVPLATPTDRHLQWDPNRKPMIALLAPKLKFECPDSDYSGCGP